MNINDSLFHGFLNSENYNKGFLSPKLITNNLESSDSMKNVLRSILTTCDEYFINVAFVTTSGFAQIRGILIELDERNIKGRIIVSSYQYFTEPWALNQLAKLKNAEVRLISDINSHSKCYVVSKNNYHDIIIGSSNLTQQALTTNSEWNLQVIASSKSDIYFQVNREFNHIWKKASALTPKLIEWYTALYYQNKSTRPQIKEPIKSSFTYAEIVPNSMQTEALENLERLRNEGAKRALIISATGTGKTYLSAFDVKKLQPKRFLFVVHRRSIAKAAMETFQTILPQSISMGLFSGDYMDENKDYLFATIQTLSRPEHLKKFNPNQFDYIVIDETHRSGSQSYQAIINYFKPNFLLGMTATPERTDGYDVFSLFHNNIAHEIRLNQAMKENLLCDFHYYGITDIQLDNQKRDIQDFTSIEFEQQSKHVLEKAIYYGADSEEIRGLVFCSTKDHCRALANYFRNNSLKTFKVEIIDSDTPIDSRDILFDRLESDDEEEKLDYLFSVDVLNEGIDIPKVNQVLMVRPTQSAIVFVQQLGRGLRKAKDKEFLTVLDFIGNYDDKNFLIPVALFGDRSFNKDKLRRLMIDIDHHSPISSTINFDRIAKERIFKSIDSPKMNIKRNLDSDYQYLKRKLGRIPFMCDFLTQEERDPFTFVIHSKSYAKYLLSIEKELPQLNEAQLKILEYLNLEVNNGKRELESIFLHEMIISESINLNKIFLIEEKYGAKISSNKLDSVINNLNFNFNKKYKIESPIIEIKDQYMRFTDEFNTALRENALFETLVIDNVKFGIEYFQKNKSSAITQFGFNLYSKYSRKDFCRVSNWHSNEESVIYGYKMYPHMIPLFVTLKKDLNISKATQYEDYFIDQKSFHWMSKHSRSLKSADIQTFMNNNYETRPVLLFIQKSNLENDFYFMGNLKPSKEVPNFIEGKIDGKSVVQITWLLENECPKNLYEYFNSNLSFCQE